MDKLPEMERDMDQQGQSGTYRVALETAMDEMDHLLQEAARLRDRMEQIGTAVDALKTMIGSVEAAPAENQRTRFELTEAAAEPTNAETYAPQPRMEVVPMPVAYHAKGKDIDPIQARIDAILGMAVA
jgi:hypothetical protein